MPSFDIVSKIDKDDGWNLIQEGPNSATADRIYAHGNRVDEVVASQYGGAWRYHHYDARGHCILLTDASGALVEQYDYDAFGRPYFFDSTAQPLNSSTVGNRFLFTGREWLKDLGLGLYDFRNRLYHPRLGRFIQPDPKEFDSGDYNLYRYCHNDPVNRTDPMGEEGWTDNPRVVWALGFNPAAIKQVLEIKHEAEAAGQSAEKQAKDNGTFTKTPDIANAVRHLVGSAELTRALGAEKAKEITDIHEDGAKNKTDSAVDQKHNALGREIGGTSKSTSDVLRKVNEALKTDRVILKIEEKKPQK